AERVIAGNVDDALFRTLGVRPALGRGIEAGDAGDTPAHVVVVSNALWKRRYGADRSLLGRSITIDGDAYTVIGITDEQFEFPRSPAMDRDVGLWVPRRPPPPMMMRRGSRDLTAVARLARGVSRQQLEIRLAALAASARQDDAPVNAGWKIRALGLRDMIVGRVKPAIVFLSSCVAVLLLIACANASAAMLARTTVRRAAYGIRLALGASGSQVMGLIVAESALLGLAAFVVAIPLGTLARSTLLGVAPVALPRQNGIAWTATTTAFAAVVAFAAAFVSVFASTLWVRRLDVKRFMNESRTTSGSRARTRALGAFIIAQTALATILFGATAALYTRYARLNSVKPGFETSGVTTATIPMRGMRYRTAMARWNLTHQLLDRVRALPGAQSAAVASLMPLSGGLMSSAYKLRDAGSAADSSSTAALRAVSPNFFRTLGIAVRKGRVIEATDGPNAPLVAIVNEAFVHQAFGSASPVGRSVTLTPPGADEPQEFAIVGVVANAKEKDLGSPDSPIIYLSDAQASFPHTVIALRSQGPAPIDGVRRSLRELDPSLALDDAAPLRAKVRATYALQIFQLSVLSVFALSAMILIVVGIYGAVTFVAAADAHANAIRLALGASPRQIASALIERIGRWSLAGGVAGVLVLAALHPALGLALQRGDLVSLVGGAFVVVFVAIAATARPSVRAGTVSALAALNAQ